MHKARIEAFSDGVIAIIITIMVLELKVPHSSDWQSLAALWPVFLSYVLSFIYIGIYWNNHHHLFQVVQKIEGSVLWANLHLLFWLSLIPFATAWMGENHFSELTVAVYSFSMLMPAIAYTILVKRLLKTHSKDTHLAKAIGSDSKGRLSLVLYGIAVGVAFWLPLFSLALVVAVAIIWLIPDRRIERVIES